MYSAGPQQNRRTGGPTRSFFAGVPCDGLAAQCVGERVHFPTPLAERHVSEHRYRARLVAEPEPPRVEQFAGSKDLHVQRVEPGAEQGGSGCLDDRLQPGLLEIGEPPAPSRLRKPWPCVRRLHPIAGRAEGTHGRTRSTRMLSGATNSLRRASATCTTALSAALVLRAVTRTQTACGPSIE
jgi:hypothetical protein